MSNKQKSLITNIVKSEYPHASNIAIEIVNNFCLWERGNRVSYRWKSQLSQHPLCPNNGLLKSSIHVSFEEHYKEGKQDHDHYKDYYIGNNISSDHKIIALWYKWAEPGAHDAEWRLYKLEEVDWCTKIKK